MSNHKGASDASLSLVDGYARLTAALLIQAVKDAYSDDWLDKLDAITWLASDDASYVGELLGVGDPWNKFINGRLNLENI